MELIFWHLTIQSLAKTNVCSDDLFVAKTSPATLLSLAYHHGYLIYSDPADNNGQLV